MRHVQSENLLKLAVDLQGTRLGMSLQDIQARFDISRRTAERMRDALERLFPQLEQANPGEIPKRWRLPFGVVNGLVAFTADELAELHGAISVLRRKNLHGPAEVLERMSAKVRALIRGDQLRKLEPDIEALLEAEGLAMRPGPRPSIDPVVIANLREAVKACRKVRIHYRGRETEKLSRQIVCPYGFLYGNRHYLVAYSMNPSIREYRLFSLSNIVQADVTEWSYVRRADFSLSAYAERSFGVFQEEPFDVVWRFSPEAARDAREFVFHPTQTLENEPDGSLIVKFRAGGVREMCWHLFTWGDAVEVLEPRHLREELDRMRSISISF